MVYVWRDVPLLRFFIPFAIGILLDHFFSFYKDILLYGTVLGFFVLVALHIYLRYRINKSIISGASICFYSTLLFLGGLINHINKQSYSTAHFNNFTNAEYLLAKVTSLPELKPKSIAAQIKVNSVFQHSKQERAIGKAQVFFQLNTKSKKLKYGDLILIRNQIPKVEEPKNPHQFNFKNYYQSKNIYNSGYITADKWINLHRNKANPILGFAYKVQSKLKSIFKRYIANKPVRGVAEAIIFGYKGELDDTWVEAFSKTGTIHVLAVSGLHVGIIYILLAWLIGLSKSTGWQLKLKALVILLALFSYCIITGFSPSVTRASLMFGLVLVAKATGRQTSIYNTLTFAAFVLILLNPNNLFNVGFQFSFLAVLGIVYYKDIFRSWLPQKSWLMDKVVTLMSVSLAAQITTFPLGLYYFHQYPNLFLFSNLIVIPCITIILYAGFFMVAMSFVSSFLATGASSFMQFYTEFVAAAVQKIQNLPFAFFEDVHISFFQMMLIYCAIFLITFTVKHKWNFGITISIVVVLVGVLSNYGLGADNKSEVLFFNHNKEVICGFRQGNDVTFFCSEATFNSNQTAKYILKPYLINERIRGEVKVLPISLLKRKGNWNGVVSLGNGFVYFANTRLLFADQNQKYMARNIYVDYVIIGNTKSKRYYSAVLSLVKNSKIVALSSLNYNNSYNFIQGKSKVLSCFSGFKKIGLQ